SFQRVLVVGFIGGGSGEVDANMETVRLLRSQLRSRSQLNVIEAEVAPLADIVKQRQAEKAAAEPTAQPAGEPGESKMISEQELQEYEQIFADVAYWKKIGEE